MRTATITTAEKTPEEALEAAQGCVEELLQHLTPNVPVELEQGYRSQPVRPEDTPRHLVRIAAVAPATHPDFPGLEKIKVIANVATYSAEGDDSPQVWFTSPDSMVGERVFARAWGMSRETRFHDDSFARNDISIAGNPAPMPRGGNLPNGLVVNVQNITATFALRKGDASDDWRPHLETIAEREALEADGRAWAATHGYVGSIRPTQAAPWGLV